MKPQELQRMAVRLHFDPAFVDVVYGGGAVEGLDEGGRAMLVAVDRRAWQTDRYRRPRALHALMEEFPASCALAGVGELDSFFSSPTFHRMIQDRGSMAQAFGTWLQARARGVATLELGLVRARRSATLEGEGLVVAPGVVPLSLPAGSLARYLHTRTRLGGDALTALSTGGVDLGELPALGEGEEHLLIEPVDGGGDLGISQASTGLVRLLTAALCPASPARMLAVARSVDASTGPAIIDGLVAEGLLVDLSSR
jgi:hypothetical protein